MQSKNYGQKFFVKNNIFESKFFLGKQKFWGKFLGKKFFGVKKIGLKKSGQQILGQKVFGSKKISVKNFWSKRFGADILLSK